jgi:hypothetical protein
MLATRRLLGLAAPAGRGLLAPCTHARSPDLAALSDDDGTSRRVAEMAAGVGAGPSAPPNAPRPWPSPAEAARLLRAGTRRAAEGAPIAPPPPAALPTLPWRDAVALARAAGLEGADPLVDSFGCVGWMGWRDRAGEQWGTGVAAPGLACIWRGRERDT